MAGKREVEIILKATDKTGKGFKSAKDEMGGAEKSASGLKDTLAKIPPQYIAIGVAVAAMAVEYNKAIDIAGKFQESILEIATLTGANAEESAALSSEIQKLSVEYGQLDTVMAKANYNAVSAGFGDAADAIIIMDVASRAAIGGLTDVNTSVKVITQTLNAYGLGAEHADKIAGDLFATVKGGVTTFEELSGSLGKVTGIAAQANVPFEEIAAGMAVLTKNGANSAEAANQLSAFILALGAATGESKVLLDEMGISLDQGLGPAFVSLAEATDGSLGKLAELIPNVRAIRAAASAASNSGEDFAEQLQAMGDGADDFNNAYETMSGSYQQAVRENEAASKALQVAFGKTGLEGKQAFLNAWTEGLEFLAGIVTENSEALTSFATNLGIVAGWLIKATAGAVGFVYWAGEKISWALGMSVESMDDFNDGVQRSGRVLENYKNTAKEELEEIQGLMDKHGKGGLIEPPKVSSIQFLPKSEIQKKLDEQAQVVQDSFDRNQQAEEDAAAQSEKLATRSALTLKRSIESQAGDMGISLFTHAFDPSLGGWVAVYKSLDELAVEMTSRLNASLAQGVIVAPKVKRDTEAAPEDHDDRSEEISDLIDLIDLETDLNRAKTEAEILAQERFVAESARFAADMEFAEERVLAWEIQQEMQARAIREAQEIADAMGRVGAETVRAFVEGERVVDAFAATIRRELIRALEDAIAKAIVLASFRFISGGISDAVGGIKDGGQIPAMAQGGGVPNAAFGYSVPDGKRGQDSRMIMAMPGEEVINRSMSRRMNRFLSAVESSAYISPWDLGSGGSGGGSTVIMNVGIPESQGGIVRMQEGVKEMLDTRNEGVL